LRVVATNFATTAGSSPPCFSTSVASETALSYAVASRSRGANERPESGSRTPPPAVKPFRKTTGSAAVAVRRALARRPRIHKFRSSQAPGHPVDQCSCSVLLRSSGSPRCRSIEAARQADLPPRRAVGAQSSSCPSTGDRLGRDCSDEPLAKRFAVTVEACLDDCDTKPECPRLPRSLEDELAVASRRSGYTVDVE
jgi:hypothetical protein